MKITYDIDKNEIYGTELSSADVKRFKVRQIMKAFRRVKRTEARFDKESKSFTISTIPSQFTFVYDTLKESIEESVRLGSIRRVEIQPLDTEGLSEEHRQIVKDNLRKAKAIRSNVKDYLRTGRVGGQQ